MTIELSDSERERYADQIEGGLGLEGQLALKRSRALVVGAGAAGSAAAAQLVSCGVGYVAVADGGTITLRDLVGQALYYTPDIGRGRAETLAAKLGLLNPAVQVESYPVEPDEQNASAIVESHDVVLLCTPDAAVGDAVTSACETSGVRVSSADYDSATGATAGAMLAAEALEVLAGRRKEAASR